MKIKHLLIISITAILIIPQLSCKKEWAASIDDSSKIYMDEFNKFYYLQAKILFNIDSPEEVDKLAKKPGYEDVLNKSKFLENLVAQKILYQKAMDDKTIDKDEFNTYIEFAKIQSVNQFYLGNKFKDRIKVTNEEIDMAYSQNRSRYAGMTAEQATSDIRQQISAMKFRNESNMYVRNLMDEHKINYDGLKEYEKKHSEISGAENKQEENK